MQRTIAIQEERWNLTAQARWGSAPPGPDVAALRTEIDQLRRMMTGRAVVDQACGMVMVLTPCRRAAARGLLVDVARRCDLGLREVAAALVATTEGESLPEQMHRALRHALRRLHTAGRR
ncbi:ANTAR domain-containing protein [Streptomyces spectabilis]|uniref:ANTAR domain-containing protein n=1 Tax=Streptomyces spectabilis TaxID=68270 RepID=A0A516R187_STRST|nr:ANTAR domain-containing protein [Streptomyces spectabilis]QDQ09425.1 ANTAR domain-containing protein [Streptomyces spectabilis]